VPVWPWSLSSHRMRIGDLLVALEAAKENVECNCAELCYRYQ
jgi:hypothetical protein